MNEDLAGPSDMEGPSDLDAPSFLAIDVETTRDFRAPRLLEFALVRVERGVETAAYHATPELLRDGETAIALAALERLASAPVAMLAAHNAAFDRRVLILAGLLSGRLRSIPWLCTLALARGRAPTLADHQLPTAAAHFGAGAALRGPEGESLHHDPRADARACAGIALGAWRRGASLRWRAYLLPAVR